MKLLIGAIAALTLTACAPVVAKASVDENCMNHAEAVYLIAHYVNHGYPRYELHKFVMEREGVTENQRLILGMWVDRLKDRPILMRFEEIDQLYDFAYRKCLENKREGVY